MANINYQMATDQQSAHTPKMEMQLEDEDDELVALDMESPEWGDSVRPAHVPAASIPTTTLVENSPTNPGVDDVASALPEITAARDLFAKSRLIGDSMLNIEDGMVFVGDYGDDDDDEEINLDDYADAIQSDSTGFGVNAMINTASTQNSVTMSSIQSSNSALPGRGRLGGMEDSSMLFFD